MKGRPPNHQLNLVVWKTTQEEKRDQRNQIFQTRCTVQGSVCNLVIDGGSFNNIASMVWVDKLGLTAKEHPNPYKLRWLNRGAEVRVTKQCLIPFSIGNEYKDEVVCDVIPIDACHILLGRPWEFERDVIHNGKENTYTFAQGNRKIVLTLVNPNGDESGSMRAQEVQKEVLFLNKAELFREMKEEHSIILLYAKETREEGQGDIPSEI